MKKNFLWLLLFIPAIFIAASSPTTNDNDLGDDKLLPCADTDGITKQFNGNMGCPYTFDFSGLINDCGSVLVDVDLDSGTPGIQHEVNGVSAHYYGIGDPVIHMLPASGYGGPGFTLSCNITAYFKDANDVITTEDVTWTCYLDHYTGPYPAGCF